MDRRIIALAAGLAAMTLAGLPARAATQCEANCDKAFQTCNGSNPDTSKCLPVWGQCKRACTTPARRAAVVTPKAQVTKVTHTTAGKAAPAKGKAKGKTPPAGKAAPKPANGVGKK